MKISELTYSQLFAERITNIYFDCEAKDTLVVIGRDVVAGHHECEETFARIIHDVTEKYGDVEVEVRLTTEGKFPYAKIKVVDARYIADKDAYIEAKGRALAAWGYTD